MHHFFGRTSVAALVILTASFCPSLAGPPFITDDPEPVDLGHWEVYAFSASTQVQGDIRGTLAGTEVNYGAAPNLQLHLIVPLAYDSPSAAHLWRVPAISSWAQNIAMSRRERTTRIRKSVSFP